ncbi:MAG: DNA repair protein RadA [Ignavibacteriales bacterium]|jgi:DNA repair protein RadA/Sms|nr:DNA repair protein RadA [Ignavibacteriaceae bacterium]NLH60516.1 DNA repair protein RadA [Ignavibacteriales bacterium]HPO55164.1 DNA repair protein RadA [Ignavibacteriaceae bacterium]
MSKIKTKYICSNCGFESIRWLGKCPDCQNWNTLVEEQYETGKSKTPHSEFSLTLHTLSEVSPEPEQRIKTGIEEFDRVLGGGLINGSLVLIGGDPGIGKSTLVLQAAGKISAKVIYVTGEESLEQIKARAHRLCIKSDNLFIQAENNLLHVIDTIKKEKPAVVVIDSIQTVYNNDFDNSPGTVTQLRECTALLMEKTKELDFTAIIIGHVTKEGIIAGPKILEHIVDVVIQFEGESSSSYRILRAHKNRYGNTNEIGIFEMTELGLEEVINPSELFLSERNSLISGSVVTSCIEGTRPLLVEVQALVTPSNYGYPQRVTNGFDQRRLSILLAVLEKRCALRLSSANVFLNIVGGIKIDEPSVDLAVCCAIASSLKDIPLEFNTLVLGEVGLGGEIRSVGHLDKRIKEASKLGFTKALLPSKNLNKKNLDSSLTLHGISDIRAAMDSLGLK